MTSLFVCPSHVTRSWG